MKTTGVDWHADESDPSDIDGQSDDDSDLSSKGSQQTDYILGFEDGQMNRLSDQNDWNISRLAGKPAFLPLKSGLPTNSELKCNNCGCQSLYLISQVYCVNDLKEAYDRVLYLFGCGSSSCQASAKKLGSPHQCLRAFRSWKLNHAYQEKLKKQERVPEWSLSSSNDNPFRLKTDSQSSGSTFNPPAADGFDCSDLFSWPTPSLNDTPSPAVEQAAPVVTAELEPIPKAKNTPSSSTPDSQADPSSLIHSEVTGNLTLPSLTSYYLTTSYESRPSTNLSKDLASLTLSQGSTSRKVESKLNSAHSKRPAKSEEIDESAGWKGEKYERQTIGGVDEAFLTFQDRVSWCGQSNQVIRYKAGGKPLPFSRLIATPNIHCEICGCIKAFELQFMPVGVALLNRLMPSDQAFTWSTAWVMTCTKDCHGVNEKDDEGWVEESVCIQWED